VDTPPKSGTTPYTTHFVFVPKSTVDIPGVGKAVAFETSSSHNAPPGASRALARSSIFSIPLSGIRSNLLR
jgi:hypothetical protein